MNGILKFVRICALVASSVPMSVTAQTAGGASSSQLIGDWVFECQVQGAPSDRCQIYQRVLTQDPNVVAMVVAVTWDDQLSQYRAQIVLPLGVDLTTPPILAAGPSYQIQLLWSRCLSNGCMFEGLLEVSTIDQMRLAKEAAVIVKHPQQGNLPIPLSLQGFPASLDRLQE